MKKVLRGLILLSGAFTLGVVVYDTYRVVVEPWFTSYAPSFTWLGLFTFVFCIWWTCEVAIFVEEEYYSRK